MAELELEGLSFRYPGASASTLEGLSLRVASGEAHALLGGSGAGKSTLLHLLAGLLEQQDGELKLGGRSLRGVAPAQRGVAQVFQFPVLYEAMTVADNLAFPLRALGTARASAARRAHAIAEHLGIGALLPRRPAALTLTEKQLVAIGKALVREDLALVLLDEPLTAAAPERKWQLRRTLKALQRETGTTMIYVTHDQAEALTFAERISVLHNGSMLQTGTPETLLAAPAHEHVGFFVGAPGMNFVDGQVSEGALRIGELAVGAGGVSPGPCRCGFRPEWARFEAAGSGGLEARIDNIRLLGTHRGRPFGLVEAQLEAVPGTVAAGPAARVGADAVTVVTRQPLEGLAPGPAVLKIDRALPFRDGWLARA